MHFFIQLCISLLSYIILYNCWLSILKFIYFDFLVPLSYITEYRNFKLKVSGCDKNMCNIMERNCCPNKYYVVLEGGFWAV